MFRKEVVYVAVLTVTAGLLVGLSESAPRAIQFDDPGSGTIGDRDASGFVNWESPHTHPIELLPGGARLAAVNTADASLELFDLSSGSPVHSGNIGVGVDPVSVRARTATEVWVVNLISDSISIVDVSTGRVTTTLKTNDEPRDVVFANGKAFVSAGGTDKVQVFDLSNLSATPGTVTLEGNGPRSMAASSDGTKVFVAFFESGNGTTILGGGGSMDGTVAFPPNAVSDPAGPYAGQNPPPNLGGGFSPAIPSGNNPAPAVGLIVKRQPDGQWFDDNNGNWTSLVTGANASLSGRLPGWDLIDHDIASIDTTSLAVTYAGELMNICMALGVNPATGDVALVGTDATNVVRFEPNVKGRFIRVNMATVNPSTMVASSIRDLNPHLDYLASSVAQSERDKSVGDPRAVAFNAAGTTAYVAGMGSNNVVGVNPATGTILSRTSVAEGPTGLAIDEARGRLYVLSKFAAKLSVMDLSTGAVVEEQDYFDPTPPAIKVGRKHLYDTHKNSGLGQISCASCHVDGRMDRLAWDLGDPAGTIDPLTGNNLGQGLFGLEPNTTQTPFQPFHPMKGPMTTQTFQDIVGKEPFHWRGDRKGLEAFAPAFVGLQGDDTTLTLQEMQEFEDFVATITFPPNPFRNFDNSLQTNMVLTGHYKTGRFGGAGTPLPNGSAQRGLTLFRSAARRLDNNAFACVTCHTLPTGAGTDYTLVGNTYQPLAVGSQGEHHLALVSVDGSTNKAIKVPQFRTAGKKTGFNTTLLRNTVGFGFLHDGSVDSLERFTAEPVFTVANDQEIADIVAFVLSVAGSELPAGSVGNILEPPGPTSKDTHATVGQQITLATTPTSPQTLTINTMLALANAGKIGLIAKQLIGGVEHGYAYNGSSVWKTDHIGTTITHALLLASASAGAELTITGVPAGAQTRLGIDRDDDTWLDGDEKQVCADHRDATSFPGGPGCVDVDGDLTIDFFDYDAFVVAFEAGTANGDFDGDATIDFFDYDAFVTAFEAGCN